jgi:hypothetical protein
MGDVLVFKWMSDALVHTIFDQGFELASAPNIRPNIESGMRASLCVFNPAQALQLQ